MEGKAAHPTELLDVNFETECFFITPIGKEGSDERKRADGLLNAVIEPSAAELGLTAIRADKIEEGGHITLQVLEHCASAKTAAADLTGGNLNVYYEVGIRHALRQPVVLLAGEEERGRLPFDLLQQRTIFYSDDMAGAATARTAVTEQLRRALGGHVDSPVQAAANLQRFQQGDATERALAELVTKVEELPRQLAGSGSLGVGVPPGVEGELVKALTIVLSGAEENAEFRQVAEYLAPVVGYVLGGPKPSTPEDAYKEGARIMRNIARLVRLQNTDEEGPVNKPDEAD